MAGTMADVLVLTLLVLITLSHPLSTTVSLPFPYSTRHRAKISRVQYHCPLRSRRECEEAQQVEAGVNGNLSHLMRPRRLMSHPW